jgi:hypothetical protein
MNKSFWLAVAAYMLPTFPIGYSWHLMLFSEQYHQLGLYRPDVIIPLGILSMLTQALLFAWMYPHLFGKCDWKTGALRFGVVFGLLSWSYTTLPIAAKYQMTSISDFMLLETGFTIFQFSVVAPLIALAYRGR